MFTAAFWRDLGERALSTFAESLAALLIAGKTGLLDAHWTAVLSVAGMATLVMLLKGVAAYRADRATGASLLPSPPPRVERGHVDLPLIIIVVAIAVFVVALANLVMYLW